MSIVGATRPDMSDDKRTTPRLLGAEHPADDCRRPARVTVRLDNNIPESCHHDDDPGPADTGCATRAEHDHRRRSRLNPLGQRFLDRGTTWWVTLVLIVLLGGLATMTVGVAGGIGASAALLLASTGALALRRRSTLRAQRENV
jgi:hypothetical protein